MFHSAGMDNHTFHDVVTKQYLEVFSKSGKKEEMKILRGNSKKSELVQVVWNIASRLSVDWVCNSFPKFKTNQ